MSEFDKENWKIYLDKQTRERIREIEDHLEDNYDGKSDYVQTKLMEEQALSLEERIKQAEQKKQKEEERLERLKQVKRERTEQQQLEDKKELLRTKQKKLDEVVDEGVSSFRDLMLEEIELRKDRGYEIDESIARACKQRAESKLDKQPDVSQLRKDVERLQQEVAELNGGRENWFLELDSMEVSA